MTLQAALDAFEAPVFSLAIAVTYPNQCFIAVRYASEISIRRVATVDAGDHELTSAGDGAWVDIEKASHFDWRPA